MTALPLALYVPSSVARDFTAPPAGVSIADKKQIYHFDAEGFSILHLLLAFGSEVTAIVLASWIYDTFLKKEPSTKEREITIREVQYRIESKDQLIEILEREIKAREKE